MADDKFPLSLWGDGDEIPGRTQVRARMPVLGPATWVDFDLLFLQRLLGGNSSITTSSSSRSSSSSSSSRLLLLLL